MGIGIFALKAACEFSNRGYFDSKKSIIDFGAQELYVKKDQFLEIVKSYGFNPDVNNFPDINKLEQNLYPIQSIKPFWYLIGFENHQCIDINGIHDSIYQDLNRFHL